MSPDLQEWHLIANGKAVEKVDAEIAKQAAKAAESDTDRFFGKATKEEIDTVYAQIAPFAKRFPQMVQSEESSWALLNWLEARRRSHFTGGRSGRRVWRLVQSW